MSQIQDTLDKVTVTRATESRLPSESESQMIVIMLIMIMLNSVASLCQLQVTRIIISGSCRLG